MKKIILSSIVFTALFTGCGGDDSSCCDADAVASNNIGTSSKKRAPIAKITTLADNTTISVGQSVAADGTSSSDKDGTVTGYKWEVDGVANSTNSKPTFTFTDAGTHKVCLTVTDNDNLASQNVECRTINVTAPVTVQTPVVPTAVISLTDSDAPLKHYTEHTFSCADSHDNDTLGTGDEIVSCQWDIQSYKIDNGTEVPYRNCSTEAMDGKPVFICGNVVRIVAKLTVTDNDGQTATTTKEYKNFTN